MKRVRIEPHTCQYKFGDRIKVLRKKKGLTQKDLAESFPNLTMDTVKNWEQHYCIPEIDTLYELCEFFECDMDYLLGRIDEKTRDIQFIKDNTGLSASTLDCLLKERYVHKFTHKDPERKLTELDYGYADIINEIIEHSKDNQSMLSDYQHLCFIRYLGGSDSILEKAERREVKDFFLKGIQYGLDVLDDRKSANLCIDNICYEIKKILSGDIQKK